MTTKERFSSLWLKRSYSSKGGAPAPAEALVHEVMRHQFKHGSPTAAVRDRHSHEPRPLLWGREEEGPWLLDAHLLPKHFFNSLDEVQLLLNKGAAFR